MSWARVWIRIGNSHFINTLTNLMNIMNKKDLKMYVAPVTEVLCEELEDFICVSFVDIGGWTSREGEVIEEEEAE